MRIFIFLVFLPVLLGPAEVFAAVVINEVAWMGTQNSASDEWLELFNSGNEAEDVSGWILSTADGGMALSLEGLIPAGGYFLIERTDDTTVPDITADLAAPFGSGLSNAGEILVLKNSSGDEIDRIDAPEGWPAGDNATKETMQKSSSGWTTAAGTPKAQNIGQAGNSGGALDQSDEDSGSQIPSESSSVPLPSVPRVKIDAGSDKVVGAGADVKFEGIATGLKGEPLFNADFLWNFGDGSIERGRILFHSFRFPGEYSVDLNVSVGGVSMFDRATAVVIPNGVSISEIKPGEEGWVELVNDSKWSLDISRWGLSQGEFAFYFPENTRILASARIVISRASSGLNFPAYGRASLLYPNAAPASSLSYSGSLAEDESFHNMRGEARVGLESPGTERFVARNSVPSSPALVPVGQSPALATEGKEEVVDRNLASVSELRSETPDFSGRPVFWFLSALGLGVVSAGGYLVIKRKGFF